MAMTKPLSEQVRFTQAGAGAVERLASEKLKEWVSVKDFGAVGDGVTDDTAAIQAAIDAFADRTDSSEGNDLPGNGKGRAIYFPAGVYLTSGITWRAYVQIVGESSSTTFFKPSPTASGFLFDLQNSTDRPKAVSVVDVSISPSRNVSYDIGASKPVVGGMNIEGFEKQCMLRDVKIYNLDGIGIKTGDTQDMEIENVEIRFCTKAFEINSKQVGIPGVINLTNAMKFVACRFENCGTSTIVGQRSTHFVACKFELAAISITDPHGLDFIGCDWALGSNFAITVAGTTDRGLRFIGGSTDTGLPIGAVGGNTALFINSSMHVSIIGMMFRGHAANAIVGAVSTESCFWGECDRPYISSTSISAYHSNIFDANVTNGTGNQPPNRRSTVASYQVPPAIVPASPDYNTWYENYSTRPIQVCLRLPYNTASAASNFEIKLRHAAGTEYRVGNFAHGVGTGSGEDVCVLTVLPGESYYHNRAGGAIAASAIGFYR